MYLIYSSQLPRVRYNYILLPLYISGNRGSERLSNLPEGAQLVSARACVAQIRLQLLKALRRALVFGHKYTVLKQINVNILVAFKPALQIVFKNDPTWQRKCSWPPAPMTPMHTRLPWLPAPAPLRPPWGERPGRKQPWWASGPLASAGCIQFSSKSLRREANSPT